MAKLSKLSRQRRDALLSTGYISLLDCAKYYVSSNGLIRKGWKRTNDGPLGGSFFNPNLIKRQ